jgi:hypothetical protein
VTMIPYYHPQTIGGGHSSFSQSHIVTVKTSDFHF